MTTTPQSDSSPETGDGNVDRVHLTERATKGARWTSVSGLSTQVIRLVTGFVLASLLEPGEFGLVGAVTIVTLFAEIVKDLGFSMAVIQAPERPTDRQLSSLFWVNMAFAVSLWLAITLAAPALADLMDSDRLVGLLRFAAVGFVLSAPSVVHVGLLRRELRFEALAVMSIVQMVGLAVVPIVLAALGYGAWSVVWGANVAAATFSIMAISLSRWRPQLRCSLREVAVFLGFSGSLSVSRIVNYFTQNGDRLLIASVLGNVQLGYYNLGFRLVLSPVRLFGVIAIDVLMPAMSRVQHNAGALARTYRRTLSVVALFVAPFMMLVAANTESLIEFGLPDSWLPASETVSILAIAGCFQGVMGVTSPLLIAMGRSGVLLARAIGLAIISMVAYFIGVQHDVETVAFAFLIALLVTFVPHIMIPARLVGITLREMLGDLVPAAVLGALVYGSVWGTRHHLVDDTTVAMEAIVPSLVGVVIALGVLLAWRPPVLADMSRVLPIPDRLRRLLDR